MIDEVGAIVFDVGSFSTKVGYAGEDAPKSEISSIVAIHDAASKLATEMDRVDSGSTPTGSKERRFYIDTTQVNVARSGQEIKTFLRDGMIDDWDLFEKMLDYIYARHIMSESSQHPVMFSEVSVIKYIVIVFTYENFSIIIYSGIRKNVVKK